MNTTKRRFLSIVAAVAAAVAVSLLGMGSTAYAHTVRDIEVTCTSVTVQFTGFPDEGVMVHITATVEGHAALATDALIKSRDSASVDISSATSALFGATAAVDVDVTWTFNGAQHAHQTLS